MIGTTHLFRQRNDEPFLDLHLFQCITAINVKKSIHNCTVNICNMYITVNRKKIFYGQIKCEFRINYYYIDVYELPNFPNERNFGKSQCDLTYIFSHSRILPPNCHWDYFVTRVKK